jgi:hypothetical protein
MSNPFKFSDSVIPKVKAALAKVQLDGPGLSISFHRQTTHPLVSKKGPRMAPGWNSSNREVTARKKFACFVLFDKHGQLVSQGRMTFPEVEKKVRELLAQR